MLKIKEKLFGTILKEQEEYNDRYIFKGELNELIKYKFKKLKENDVIEEMKYRVGKNQDIYYKKSGLGYFIIFKEKENIIFMSGVPIWWIGDEYATNYYDDLNILIEADLVQKVSD